MTEYLTEHDFRLLVAGAGSAALAVALVGLLRRPSGLVLGFAASWFGLFVTGWSDWPDPTVERLAATVSVGVVAGVGYERLRSSGPPVQAPLVALAASGGIWLGVPENSPAVVMIGVLLGLLLTRRADDTAVGYGVALGLAWSVLLGARSSGWSFDGGLLCIAPLVAVPVVGAVVRGRGLVPAWPVYVVGAGAVSFTAARWVGVAPDASWARVAVVAAAAVALAAVVRRER